MNLRTGTTVWQTTDAPLAETPPLRVSESCDVVIIGGGISGALCALQLARLGHDVIVLDRRDPISGSTPASTALIQYDLDVPLTRLRNLIGRANADRAYRACYEAVCELPAFAKSFGASASLTARPSLYVAGKDMDAAALGDEATQRAGLGIDAKFIDANVLSSRFGVRRAGAILSGGAFEADPVQLARHALNEAIRYGARVYGQTEARWHGASPRGVTVSTCNDRSVHARHLICAAGYESAHILGFNPCTLSSTYAVASPAGAASAIKTPAMIWEAASPYLYARTTKDGRIVVGGEDEPFADADARDALTPAKSATLARKFSELMPEVPFTVEKAWAGTFAETRDSLPFIGAVAGFPNSLFTLGYGGNGILFSYIASKIACDLVRGCESPLEDLLSFDRAARASG